MLVSEGGLMSEKFIFSLRINYNSYIFVTRSSKKRKEEADASKKIMNNFW